MRQDLDRLMKERGLAGLVVFANDRDNPLMEYATGQAMLVITLLLYAAISVGAVRSPVSFRAYSATAGGIVEGSIATVPVPRAGSLPTETS